MLKVRLDNSVFLAKMARTEQLRNIMRDRAVKELTHAVLVDVVANPHRDTNRNANGWATAGNAALRGEGLGALMVRPYNRASNYAKFEAELIAQVRKWGFLAGRYERASPPRTKEKGYRQAKRRYESATLQLQRFYSTHGDAAIVMDSSVWLSGGAGVQRSSGLRALATVRHKIYGGTGRVERVGDRTFVHLHNREPHVSIVEKRFSIMKSARMVFRGVGLKLAGKRYIDRIAARAGWRRAAG